MEQDVLIGWIVVVLVLLMHFLITVSLGNSYFAESSLNRMLWLSSFPAFLIAFVAAFFQKTNTVFLAVRRGLLWTIELMVTFTILDMLPNQINRFVISSVYLLGSISDLRIEGLLYVDMDKNQRKRV